jgi:cell fate regulator YaaT (PSP1 superfamily)
VAHLVEVGFKGNRREFFLWSGEDSLAPRVPVVVEADRGEDLGRVYAIGDIARLRARGCTHGTGNGEPTQNVLRVASPDDLRKLAELRRQDDTTRRDATQLVGTHSLPMKLTDTEWRWDKRKLTIYFTADRRVDFRALVRDLAGKFRTRIELKQIGVRDEAKRLDGVGRCGRQYCSASWLPELRPVNLGLAKDQKLSLNPMQISGACGRLMCCLRYEHDWYVETRRLFPKEGKLVTTAVGEEKVIANDLFRDRVTLRKALDGELRIIPLAQLNRELRGEPIETDEATESPAPDEWSDEIISMTDTVERPIPRMPAAAQQRSERPVRIERAPRATGNGQRATGNERTAKPSTPPAPPAPPQPVAPQTAAALPEQESQRKRPRRRRGRRGGRRGESGDTGNSNPPGNDNSPSKENGDA